MPNAYHRRRADRLQKARDNRASASAIKLMDIERIQRSYEDAFKELHGCKTTVSYSHGWYWVHNKRVRQSVLMEMTDLLLARIHEGELLCENLS